MPLWSTSACLTSLLAFSFRTTFVCALPPVSTPSTRSTDDASDFPFIDPKLDKFPRPGESKGNPAWIPNGCDGIECIEKYIAKPDDKYSWYDTGAKIHGRTNNVQWTGHVLNMSSLRWETPAAVDFPDWWHVMIVVVPDVVLHKDWATMTLDFGVNYYNSSLLRIDNRMNGNVVEYALQPEMEVNSENLDSRTKELQGAAQKAAYLATSTNAITTSVLCLPNAFETFQNDEHKMHRAMDFLKAYSYADYIRNDGDDPIRISELPMTKAVVRAMDTMTQFTNGAVTRFGVTGYSKLGTIAWILGVVDKRVEAIVPMAINLDLTDLDPFEPPGGQELGDAWGKKVRPQMLRAQRQELVKPPISIEDEMQKRRKLSLSAEYLATFSQVESPAFRKLHKIVDPSSWGRRLTLKKHFTMAANDNLFVDLTRKDHWWHRLPEPKSFNEIPNCMHEATLIRNVDTTAAFFLGHLQNLSAPEMTEEYNKESGTITVHQKSNHKPTQILHWSAHTVATRDFSNRLWTSVPIEKGVATISEPPTLGFSASFVELKYEWPDKDHHYTLTTPVHVLPF